MKIPNPRGGVNSMIWDDLEGRIVDEMDMEYAGYLQHRGWNTIEKMEE